jgi:hypothetical protein
MHPLPHTPSWRSTYLVKHRATSPLPLPSKRKKERKIFILVKIKLYLHTETNDIIKHIIIEI